MNCFFVMPAQPQRTTQSGKWPLAHPIITALCFNLHSILPFSLLCISVFIGYNTASCTASSVSGGAFINHQSSKFPVRLQASKDYPQLAEHAARMKCQPSTEFGQFLQTVMRRETAPNYDNVIATSNWIQEEDSEQPTEVYPLTLRSPFSCICAKGSCRVAMHPDARSGARGSNQVQQS